MGGIRLGLEQALEELNIKGECVLTSEIKPFALQVYKDNFGDKNIYGDITKIKSENIPNFDMLLSGFPCQSFSSAGKQLGFEDARGTLFFEVARILKDKQPKYFLLENVENLVIHDKKDKSEEIGNTLKVILATLEELGYFVTWKVLKASDFGVPQIRKRIYIAGSKTHKIELENFDKTNKVFKDIQETGIKCNETEFSIKLFNYLKENNLPIEYLYDKSIRDKRGKENNLHSWNLELRGETTQEQRLMLEKLVSERRRKDYAKQKKLPLKDGIGLTSKEMKNIYNGENFEQDIQYLLSCGYLKKEFLNTINEYVYDINGGRLSYEFTKILDPNKLCLTLVATDAAKLGVIDNGNIRKLTITECLKLNGFPDNYKMNNINYSQSINLLGNTVVVPVIKEVCKKILSTY
jgi:DNA (cytosine-5)-methyltransferase 1